MFKKIIFLSISFITVTSFAMEKAQDLKQWVQDAKEIRIKTALLGMSIVAVKKLKVPINDNTTILDVKSWLQAKERVFTHDQSLYPLQTNWWTLGLVDKQGEKLEDNQNIKQIMQDKNSDRFLMLMPLKKAVA